LSGNSLPAKLVKEVLAADFLCGARQQYAARRGVDDVDIVMLAAMGSHGVKMRVRWPLFP